MFAFLNALEAWQAEDVVKVGAVEFHCFSDFHFFLVVFSLLLLSLKAELPQYRRVLAVEVCAVVLGIEPRYQAQPRLDGEREVLPELHGIYSAYHLRPSLGVYSLFHCVYFGYI